MINLELLLQEIAELQRLERQATEIDPDVKNVIDAFNKLEDLDE